MDLREVYLAMRGVRSSPTGAAAAARRLYEEVGSRIVTVRVAYRDDPDTALVQLRLRIESAWQLSDVIVWAYNEGVRLLDPTTMTAPARQHFRTTYAAQFRRLPRVFADPEAALCALTDSLMPAPPDELAQGAVRVPRPVAMEWRAPRVDVVDRTRTGRGTRTASGIIHSRRGTT